MADTTPIVFSAGPSADRTEAFMVNMFDSQGRLRFELVSYKRPDTTWAEVEAEARRQFADLASRRDDPPPAQTIVISNARETILEFQLGC